MPPADHPQAERRRWLGVLARASAAELRAHLGACADRPIWRVLRGPENGLVMLRGRAGGGGSGFNLGEITVTRCTVRLDSGEIGHAYALGCDPQQAELAAAFDALLQDPTRCPTLTAAVIDPLAAAQAERRAQVAARAAATKVQFFTMRNMRG